MKNIYIILILICILTGISFLIKGNHWLYLDNNWYPLTFNQYIDHITIFLYSINSATYFGYDDSVLLSSRFLGYFFQGMNDFLLYFIFLFCSGLSSFLLLRLTFSKKTAIYSSLLYAVNPVSFYFLNLTGFIFAYISLPLIILAIYYIIKTKKYIFILILLAGGHFLISYTRTLGIYLLLLLFLGVWFYREIFAFMRNNIPYILGLSLTILLYFSPFLLSITYSHFDGQSEYFKGLSNYAETSASWGEGLYIGIKDRVFLENIIPREIISNFANSFQKSMLFSLISYLFVTLITIIFLFQNYRKKNGFPLYILGILLFTIFFIASPKFIGQQAFTDICYKYFPFIANNTYWLHTLTIPLIIYIFAYVLENTTKVYASRLLLFLLSSYILVTLYPIVGYKENPKLSITHISDFPDIHKEKFWNKKDSPEASLFYPGTYLLFNWAKYPLTIRTDSYKEVFSSNNRHVNDKQLLLQDITKMGFSSNLSLLNVKNVIILNNIRNLKSGEFDFLQERDYIGEMESRYDELINNTGLLLYSDNEEFTHFELINKDKYNFSLYSPGIIDRRDVSSFLSGEIDINKKSIVIDPESFHKPSIIDTYEIPIENKNISIVYKNSMEDTTKIYAKISNIDSAKPFLLQLNQTFGMSWKVKWITKEEFEEKPCIDNYKEYPITQNAVCQFNATILDLRDTKYLDNPSVSEEHHFEGNFVGNAWLVTPDDIPEDMRGQSELYAVIIYEKQIYYAWTLVISGLTFLVLILLTIRESVISYRQQKYDK